MLNSENADLKKDVNKTTMQGQMTSLLSELLGQVDKITIICLLLPKLYAINTALRTVHHLEKATFFVPHFLLHHPRIYP